MPIIEPEVLMDGDHDAQSCYDVTASVLKMTWDECKKQEFTSKVSSSNQI